MKLQRVKLVDKSIINERASPREMTKIVKRALHNNPTQGFQARQIFKENQVT